MTMETGKSVVLVEMDLDFYRITRFEGTADGATPRNWTSVWDANTTLVGITDYRLPAGNGVRATKTVGDDDVFWRWDLVPTDSADVSCVAALRANGTQVDMGIVLRGSGADGTETSYRVDLTDTDLIRIARDDAGVITVLETLSFPWAADELIWLRADVITTSTGELIRASAWRGALTDEPSQFLIDYTDAGSTVLTGAVGLHISNDAATVDVGHFRMRSLFSSNADTYRYAQPTNYLPKDLYPLVPNIVSISHTPATISLGENIGTRAQVNVEFHDHPYSDFGELATNGTYWGKFRARKLFRRGQPLRTKFGLSHHDIDDYETRHFVLDSFDGPTAQDRFRITAQDILKLASNDRAQAPVISNGYLSADLTDVATSFTLSPSGIGNDEYPSSGYAAIGGEEIVAFTRTNDTMNITRAQYGTTARSHSAEDRVQLCLIYSAQDPAFIIHDLLTNYAEINTSYIDLTTWSMEVDTFLQRLYGRVIAEPTGVEALLNDLIQQAGLILWWDNVEQTLRLQVLRGISTDAFTYSENNVIDGSIVVTEQPGKRVTQVWTYYGVRNPLESLDEDNNYRSTVAYIDPEAAEENGSAVIKKIRGTWIPDLGRTTADRVNELIIGRYVDPPRLVKFSVGRYSGIEIPREASGYQFEYHGSQDEAGDQAAIPIQVTQVDPRETEYIVTAEEMLFEQFNAADLQDRVVLIDSNTNNVNFRTSHDSIYPVLTDEDVLYGVTVTCIINAGVIVGSSSTALNSFEVGDWPVGFTPSVQILGRIEGAGGDGGNGRIIGLHVSTYNDGTDGGTAFYTRHPVNLLDEYGELWGGGGGGEGGNGTTTPSSGAFAGGGGGGAGSVPGSGGDGFNSADGNPGTTEAGGTAPGSSAVAGADAGGGPGQAGGGLDGGAAGNAIDGLSYVTTIGAAGDRRGGQVN